LIHIGKREGRQKRRKWERKSKSKKEEKSQKSFIKKTRKGKAIKGTSPKRKH
jgi:hypothetical protein